MFIWSGRITSPYIILSGLLLAITCTACFGLVEDNKLLKQKNKTYWISVHQEPRDKDIIRAGLSKPNKLIDIEMGQLKIILKNECPIYVPTFISFVRRSSIPSEGPCASARALVLSWHLGKHCEIKCNSRMQLSSLL